MGLMGLSTFVVGLLPSYASIGVAAPIMLVAMRLIQGLALGGEYGGAATYVAEHAPNHRRGLYTSFIQTTATLGLFAALLVVIGTRTWLGEEAFKDWGWRVPFLVSIVLLAVSMWIRMQLSESPVFLRMKEEGTTSKAPLTEAFGQWKNARWVLIALLGAVAGQAVVWYTGQFYALFFLGEDAEGGRSDRQRPDRHRPRHRNPGLHPVRLALRPNRTQRRSSDGLRACGADLFTAFQALTHAANPALAEAQAQAPVVVFAHAETCSLQFDPLGREKFDKTGCDIAKSTLAKAGIPYANEDGPTITAPR
jgi:hypothetical protein